MYSLHSWFHAISQAEVGVDKSKYSREPGGKPLLLLRAHKRTLKQEELYSSLNSERVYSDGAADEVKLRGRN